MKEEVFTRACVASLPSVNTEQIVELIRAVHQANPTPAALLGTVTLLIAYNEQFLGPR